MRRPMQFVLVSAAVLLASAEGPCRKVSSLQPLFADGDLVREPALVGVWAAPDSLGRDRWVFVATRDTGRAAYALALTPPANAAALARLDLKQFVEIEESGFPRGATAAMRAQHARDSAAISRLSRDGGGARLFEARLGRLGGSLFMDMVPMDGLDEPAPHGPGPLTIPIHWFWRASLDGDSLRLVPLNRDWLGTMIDSGRVTLAHETRGDNKPGELVLTAPTADLQAFVAAHATDTAAFAAKHAIVLRRAAAASGTSSRRGARRTER